MRPVIDSASSGKPLAAYLVPDAPEALAALATAGVPSFRSPEACADAIAAALRRRAPATSLWTKPGTGRMLDELGAYQVLAQLGIACAPAVSISADIAEAPDLPFPYPVAVKALSAAIAHKTEMAAWCSVSAMTLRSLPRSG